MTDLIERVALNLRLAGMCHTHTHSVQTAQAAIAAIQADADLDRIKRERDQAVEALKRIAPGRMAGWKSGEVATEALASIEGTGHE